MQNDEQVPIAGIVVVVTGATAEQKHGFRLHQCNDGRHCRMKMWVQMRHDLIDRNGCPPIGACTTSLPQVGLRPVHRRTELDGIGYRGEGRAAVFPAGAYFELHIEQGPILANEAKQIGTAVRGGAGAGQPGGVKAAPPRGPRWSASFVEHDLRDISHDMDTSSRNAARDRSTTLAPPIAQLESVRVTRNVKTEGYSEAGHARNRNCGL